MSQRPAPGDPRASPTLSLRGQVLTFLGRSDPPTPPSACSCVNTVECAFTSSSRLSLLPGPLSPHSPLLAPHSLPGCLQVSPHWGVRPPPQCLLPLQERYKPLPAVPHPWGHRSAPWWVSSPPAAGSWYPSIPAEAAPLLGPSTCAEPSSVGMFGRQLWRAGPRRRGGGSYTRKCCSRGSPWACCTWRLHSMNCCSPRGPQTRNAPRALQGSWRVTDQRPHLAQIEEQRQVKRQDMIIRVRSQGLTAPQRG